MRVVLLRCIFSLVRVGCFLSVFASRGIWAEFGFWGVGEVFFWSSRSFRVRRVLGIKFGVLLGSLGDVWFGLVGGDVRNRWCKSATR